MRGVYIPANSRFYWLKYYDKTEPVLSKRPKRISTKIPASLRDLNERDKASQEKRTPIYTGTADLRSVVKIIRKEITYTHIEQTTQITIPRSITFMQSFNNMLAERTVPQHPKYLKPGTVKIYNGVAEHFINACGDLPVTDYSDNTMHKLLVYLNKKNHSKTYISIITRTLRAIFNYFIKKKLCISNPIETTRATRNEPVVISDAELSMILDHLRKSPFKHNYFFVKFLQLTGCRPSSAMVQRIDKIDKENNVIYIENVKTNLQKSSPYYQFPLYPELAELIDQIKDWNKSKEEKYPNPQNRLFPQFGYTEHHYNESLKFFPRAIKQLLKTNKITRRYTLKHLRSTFASKLINSGNFNILVVNKLLDHADIKTTKEHYAKLLTNEALETLKNIPTVK